MNRDDINRLKHSELKPDFFDETFEAAKREIVNMLKDDIERENQSPLFYPEK